MFLALPPSSANLSARSITEIAAYIASLTNAHPSDSSQEKQEAKAIKSEIMQYIQKPEDSLFNLLLET